MDAVRGLLAALLVAAACSAASPPIVLGGAAVTYSGSPQPDCSPKQVAQTVRTFLDSFNRGDQEALRQIFQRSLIFSAPNPPPVGFFLSSGQPSLLNYFANRHAHGEMLELTALQIQYGDGSNEAGLQPTINRRADDMSSVIVTAKAAIDCDDGAIVLWNLGSSY